MGIPSYFSYIVKNHPEIITKFLKGQIIVNNLYLDCNSIIYDSVRNINFDVLTETATRTIIIKVIQKIEEYISIISPNYNVIIAFDGVACC